MKRLLLLVAFAGAAIGAIADADQEKEFDEAIGSGRPLAAESAFKKLFQERRDLAPIRYFQAAEVSRQLGKPADRRTRLSHFIKVSKAWNDSVEQAAWELCRHSDDADAFVILAEKSSRPRELFNTAIRLLDTFRRQKRSVDFLKVAESAFAAFKGDEDRFAIMTRVVAMATEGNLGLSDDDLKAFLERNVCHDLSVLNPLLRAREALFPRIWRFRLSNSSGVLPSQPSLMWCVQISTNADERAEAMRFLRKFEPIVFDGKHARHACQMARLRVALAPELFKSREAKSAAACADFEKVAKSEGQVKEEVVDLMRFLAEKVWTAADTVRMRDAYPQFVQPNLMHNLFRLAESCENAKSTKPYHDILPRCQNAMWTRYCMLPTLAKLGDTAEVKQSFSDELLFGGANDYRCLLEAVRVAPMSDKDRSDLFATIYARTGAHPFWNWCASDKWALGNPALTNAAAKAFLGTIKKDAKSKARIVEIRREMNALSRLAGNVAPEAAHKLFAEACNEFKGFWPQQNKWESRVFGSIAYKYVDLCRFSGASAPIALKAIGEKIDPKDEKTMREILPGLIPNSIGERKALIELARRTQNAGYLMGVSLDAGTEKSPVPVEAFAKENPNSVVDFIERNWSVVNPAARRITPELAASLLTVVFKNFDCGKLEGERAHKSLFPIAVSVVRAKPELAAAFPIDKTAGEVLDPMLNRGQTAYAFLKLCAACGKLDACLNRYVAALAKLDPGTRISRLISLCESSEIATFGNAEKGTMDRFDGLFRTQLMPALKATPSKFAPLVWAGDSSLAKRVREWSALEGHKGKPETKATVDEFFRGMVRLKDAGAAGWVDINGNDPNGVCSAPYYRAVYEQGLGATNAVMLAQVSHQFGVKLTQFSVGEAAALSYFSRLRDEGMWEALYLLTSALIGVENNSAGVMSAAARFRAEASTHLPGVYPVSEKDPLYPLYVAADEFTRNNFERATELLKANLPAFERDAAKLPPAFTAWAVDQMRLMRGEKDAMLVRARALATKLLDDESRLTPEVAAAMVLVRAESFRDQQNFEAAKLEYQTLRNNPAYLKTHAARRAMFRSVDLMIESGNAAAAEPTLEYWLSQPDTEVQAQAHYFLARIAFERKDYEECAKRLREVFAIDFTHTEARFLQGQWKLATNSEVDETEVLVGSVSDRTTVRPGQQLSITVQDRNLSVAGGGSAIPVIVRAVPGGDFEMLQLTPSSRDPGLFKGAIDVKLAAPVASNLVLEVTGADTVSYAIDPAFLAARGLPVGKPKEVSVVDDARLAIGAGSPRVDEAESAAQVEALVDDGASDVGRGVKSIRPGNPLHIALSDKDRSLGKEGGSVQVAVSTTSGDRIADVELKEVRPFSGVFRGSVRTALPPPRAFASDTAVGFNPGDVINSTRSGSWRSLSDGQPVKWFEVDTMGSYLFSNAVIRMTAPDDITKIRLVGTLAGRKVSLGAFPADDPKTRVGFCRQVSNRGGFRGEQSLRDFMESAGAPKREAVTNIVFAPPWFGPPTAGLFSGVFVAPEKLDFLRFRIVPQAKSADALKGVWLSIALDGECVFSGSGRQLAGALAAFELSVGVHRLEVFATGAGQGQGSGTRDTFSLLWEKSEGEAPVPIPTEWFSADLHPELVSFVSDRATIVKEAGGFSATFPEPVRLRTLRWEFLGRRGPYVSIDSMEAVDAEGKKILPVESDFSDAQQNDILEVAPGDRISVAYADARNSRGVKRKVEKAMMSSFNNASVGFFFESDDYQPNVWRSRFHEAYRFVPGDSLVVSVSDYDLDATDEADTVEAKVSTRSGKSLVLKLVEQKSDRDLDGIHTGNFLGLVKTAPAGSGGGKDTVETVENDVLTLEYLDRENTNPGVPVVRSASVAATRRTKPVVTLFRAGTVRVVDDSLAAKSRIDAIRRRPGNESVEAVYRDEVFAEPMDPAATDTTNAIVMNIDAPLLVRVSDPSRARHARSRLMLEAVAASGAEDAEPVCTSMRLGAPFTGAKLRAGVETPRAARQAGSFNGTMRVIVGTAEAAAAVAAELSGGKSVEADEGPGILPVVGNDTVRLRVKDGDEVVAERTIVFAADATLDLMDSTLEAERTSAHCGERFYVRVKDADRDTTDEADTVEVSVKGSGMGVTRKIALTETMPHSGVFVGVVRPVIFARDAEMPSVVTGGVAKAASDAADDRLPVRYGDSVEFSYVDERPFSSGPARTITATGRVSKGSDGSLRVFSKRFRDVDQAVLVQFRLAECLFEQAKEHRRRKQTEKSSEAIARGRFILEEALKNYPGTVHASQGEFLLANLSQELAAESKEAGDEEKARQLYTEALSRFSAMLAVSPRGEYAARAQYHKALCLEMLGDFRRAGEEYVKMTYLYPESDLVGDATVRLATHYYKNEKRYDVSARIYENFQKRFPNHSKASRALFMCGSCYVKEGDRVQAEFEKENGPKMLAPKASKMYTKAMKAFESMAETYRSDRPEMRAQALYWAGDAALRARQSRDAYLFLKRTVLEYPETEWARRARGLLLQESDQFKNME